MDNKEKLEQLLLLKYEYKIMMEKGDKKGAWKRLEYISQIYNEITGKNFWDLFSEDEKELIESDFDKNLDMMSSYEEDYNIR